MSDSETSPWMTQCPMCGSEIPLNATRCWLCGEHQPGLTRPGPQPFDSQAERILKLISSIAILITVGLVWFGVTVDTPGLGIAFLMALIIPIVRTTYVMNERLRQEKANSKIELLFLFSTSFLMTSILLVLVAVVAFFTFCITCLMAGGGYRGDSDGNAPAVIAGIAALAVVGGLIWLAWRTAISPRIQRDIDKK